MADDRKRYTISDDTGVLWRSDEYDAFEEGSRIISAVDRGWNDQYVDQIGVGWKGDLVLALEIARTR